MARISVRSVNGTPRVTIRGRLTADDLGRLERACGSALEHREVALELNLAGILAIDDAARAFLDRLVQRGAVVIDVDSQASARDGA